MHKRHMSHIWILIIVGFVSSVESNQNSSSTVPAQKISNRDKIGTTSNHLRTSKHYWSNWSEWSSCSSSCGEGTRSRRRQCLKNSKQPRQEKWRKRLKTRNRRKHGRCPGADKQFRLCNNKLPCRVETMDFRNSQCQSFDNKPIRGRYFRWRAHILPYDRCVLNCQAIGYRFSRILARAVADGTFCGKSTVCIQGKCKAVGCDGIIGSKAKFDRCGICGGNNSTCRIFSGLFTRFTLSPGYNLVTRIPKGSCNVTATELRASPNLLALKTRITNKYIINGNWERNPSGTYSGAGTLFTYKNHEANVGEQITSTGPLSEDVDLLIVYSERNFGVKYEYSQPIDPFRPSYGTNNGTLDKSVNDQSRYNVRFSHGHQRNARRRHGVASYSGGRTLPLSTVSSQQPKVSYGNGNNRLYSRRRNHKETKIKANGGYMWRVTGVTPCSASCVGGTQSTLISCIEEITGQIIDGNFCDGDLKPVNRVIECNSKPCHARWNVTPWSLCSVTCGKGVQTRKVNCKQRLSSTLDMMVPEGACLAITAKPSTTKVCRKSCAHWKTAKWSMCTVSCGIGRRTRKVSCVDRFGTKTESNWCNGPKPVEEESCDMGTCPQMWIYSNWDNRCSVNCGHGIQKRHVVCLKSGRMTSDDNCILKEKPKIQKTCTNDVGCSAKWFTGPWSQCSAICGSGMRSRDVTCMKLGNINGRYIVVGDEECLQESTRPNVTDTCIERSCKSRWFVTDWSGCTATCGGGIQSRVVMCIDDEKSISDSCDGRDEPVASRQCNNSTCPSLPKEARCMDEYSHCDIVLQARLCKYKFYKDKCCESCNEH